MFAKNCTLFQINLKTVHDLSRAQLRRASQDVSLRCERPAYTPGIAPGASPCPSMPHPSPISPTWFRCFRLPRLYEVPAPEEQVRAFLAERLRQGDSTLFLARDAERGRWASSNSIRCSPPWRYDLRGCSAISTSARRARRRGVGEALMNQARGFAESMGACGLQLETAKTNHAGQSLYERLGYVRDEQFYTYWLQL